MPSLVRRLIAPARLGGRPASGEKSVTSGAPAAIEAEPGSFNGVGYTGWHAEGRLRKATSVRDERLLRTLTNSDILLCDGETLDYHNDWLPVFLTVKGLVITDHFSGLHHAAQIARECGVAFVHLPNSKFDPFVDGAEVTVNGKTSSITIRV